KEGYLPLESLGIAVGQKGEQLDPVTATSLLDGVIASACLETKVAQGDLQQDCDENKSIQAG
ncbi:MAG TPA: hypothetical protein V6D04_05085, partial [Candidatus Obscuribacterales bacterium]